MTPDTLATVESHPTGAQLFALWLTVVIFTASVGAIISGPD